MATTAISLHLRDNLHHRRLIQNPKLLNFFSSSSSSDDDQTSSSPAAPPPQQFKSSLSSYLSDVKTSLKQSHSPLQRPGSSFSPAQPSSSMEDIRKNLSEFRRRTAVPDPTSLPDLYKRNVVETGPNYARTGPLSFESIRKSITNLKISKGHPQGDGLKMSVTKLKETLKPRLPVNNNNMGDNNNRPMMKFPDVFEDKKGPQSEASRLDFLRKYRYNELGEKLRELRPEVKGKNWFSLAELNERLQKLRKSEEKESSIDVNVYTQVRESLFNLKLSEMKATTAPQQFDIGTSEPKLSQPNEKLVEKYFHPDNMSSSEKLKIELKKVRDEFKMSESDCGSARVQVAQLTTKIKHLSSVLHKKDKHSRKGLNGMVQQRKKLLKYLRRTDWDSYCYVLSKLGLRDNPDYKS